MISVIIPTYNEAGQIAKTISAVTSNNSNNNVIEIIIVDGGSTDETVSIAKENGAVTIISERKGRAAQMNRGAFIATGSLFYFLHADSIPPKGFTEQIVKVYNNGFTSGCFRLQFDYKHWFLQANAWFTRWDVNAIRFGDQSLFVTKNIFQKCGGFREDLWMMEDQEIIYRIKQHSRFTVMNDYVITSARKYHDNGIYRMQAIFFRIWFLYYLGYSQEHLLQLYKRLIRKHKL